MLQFFSDWLFILGVYIISLDTRIVILFECFPRLTLLQMATNINYRVVGKTEKIDGKIEHLKMYMCAFAPEKRQLTQHYILHPCFINLHSSTPPGEEGMNISLKTSAIFINISPAALELFNKAMKSLTSNDTDESKKLEQANYNDIWTPKKFKDNDFWFLKAGK